MTAVAIFVKTPGLSPVKTRLAKGVGSALATEFHRRAASAVGAVAHAAAHASGSVAIALRGRRAAGSVSFGIVA